MSALGVSLPLLFGPYELLVRLGHGGMGQVFLARRTTMGGADSVCVLKTLKPELAEDPEYVGRFLDEVRTVMQLRHSSISHVFDAGNIGGTYYMAMEHLSGVTARELWSEAQQGKLDTGLALILVEDVLAALAYAHAFKSPLSGAQLSVVHRDVSPHNVIVTFEGEVKLIDFGLAESVLKQEHTESKVVMGKISYMSPEQARGESVDGACDQFAAAIMLYELVSGERFYGARNNSEIWTVVGFGGFRPERFAELPPELRQILDRALAKNAADRFPECGEFRAALEALHAKSYPSATRSRLRAFMQQAFADAQHQQQQALVHSAAVASEVQQFTQSVSASRPSAPSATTVLARDRPVVEPTGGVPKGEPSGAALSESLRLPANPARPALAALALIVVVALGAFFLLSSREEPAPPGDDVQVLEAVARPSTPDVPVTTAPEATEPETTAPSVTIPAPPPTTTAEIKPEKRTRKPPPSPTPEVAVEPPVTAEEEPASPAGTTTKKPVKPVKTLAPMTNAEALEIVKRCQRTCAPAVMKLSGVKDGSVVNEKPNALLINCARKCL